MTLQLPSATPKTLNQKPLVSLRMQTPHPELKSSDFFRVTTRNLADCLVEASVVVQQLEEIQFHLNRMLVKKLENPLNNLLKSEIPAAENQKKKYDRTGKGKSDTSSPIFQETSSTLGDTCKIISHQTMKSLSDMMELYQDSFEKSHKVMRRLIPTMMEFRSLIELEVFLLSTLSTKNSIFHSRGLTDPRQLRPLPK